MRGNRPKPKNAKRVIQREGEKRGDDAGIATFFGEVAVCILECEGEKVTKKRSMTGYDERGTAAVSVC